VKPQLAHAASAALPYQLDWDTWVCCDYYAVDLPRNGPEIRIARCALRLGGVRVDSNRNGWLPKNTVLQIIFSRFLNVSGEPKMDSNSLRRIGCDRPSVLGMLSPA
jgi:hypothetical protein